MVLSSKIALIFTKAYIGYLISNLLAKGQVCPTSSGGRVHKVGKHEYHVLLLEY